MRITSAVLTSYIFNSGACFHVTLFFSSSENVGPVCVNTKKPSLVQYYIFFLKNKKICKQSKFFSVMKYQIILKEIVDLSKGRLGRLLLDVKDNIIIYIALELTRCS